jgi:hypothetical protein
MLKLDFACWHCQHPVGVTLQCTGSGVRTSKAKKSPRSVKIPCPTCGGVNQLHFNLDGAIHEVEPVGVRSVPAPSMN